MNENRSCISKESAYCVETGKAFPGCICGLHAEEPNDNCPMHGGGYWPPQCAFCGKYMKWEKNEK